MSLVETIKELTNPYHAYVFGTAFWYFLRGLVRIIAPETVAEWFRPPVQATMMKKLVVPSPSDLELYNIRTDAWGLWVIGMMLLALADAVPLPASLVGSSLADKAPSQYKKPYARAAVIITVFHHITTGIGAYQHWRLETHHTPAMDIGVYGNVFFTLLGVTALVYGLNESAGERKKV
ncbi:hypothetical protein LTR62_006142 [Meristemomyces frigidus]|uniref:Uncharacterized protein n=1 Tax=Meristemomyces frigidus TaxID=1508187 RepID=A0AAN7YN45_9PEZI|nr:hypothetical protein LTR62_006142 [Meristemomyces frigidus]